MNAINMPVALAGYFDVSTDELLLYSLLLRSNIESKENAYNQK